MPTRVDELKEELKTRNKSRKQSPLETWVLQWLPLAKLYDYDLEYQVDFYFIDIAWPKIKIGIELDGKEFHVKERDQKRDAYLNKQGWQIYRIPSSECWNPKLLGYHLINIYMKVNPNCQIPYGLAEFLGITDKLIAPHPPIQTYYDICVHCEKKHQIPDHFPYSKEYCDILSPF